MGCFTRPLQSQMDGLNGPRYPLINSGDHYDTDTGAVVMEHPSVDQCASICEGFSFVGLQGPNICWCADTYDSLDSVPDRCGIEGELCFMSDDVSGGNSPCSNSVLCLRCHQADSDF